MKFWVLSIWLNWLLVSRREGVVRVGESPSVLWSSLVSLELVRAGYATWFWTLLRLIVLDGTYFYQKDQRKCWYIESVICGCVDCVLLLERTQHISECGIRLIQYLLQTRITLKVQSWHFLNELIRLKLTILVLSVEGSKLVCLFLLPLTWWFRNSWSCWATKKRMNINWYKDFMD